MEQLGPRGPRSGDARVSMSAARAGVLDALRRRGGDCSVKELADEFDLHPNTVREHLDALVDEGLAARETATPQGRGRPALVYRFVGDAKDAARDYELLTDVLAEQVATLPDPTASSLAAGRSWGERMLAQGDCEPGTEGVQRVMTRMGFDPTPVSDSGEMVLRGCPILGSAKRRPDVVCTVHLGLARALVEAAGGAPDQVQLDPMAANGCILRLPAPQPRR